MSYSVAFKCTYNDGDEGVYVGFKDTCSIDNIKRNVENKRVWCSNEKCECAKFYDKGLTGDKPTPPHLCMESELFREWKFGAGDFHHGTKKGEPKRITKAKPGGFAILTTRFPGEPEKDRRIIGLFRIASIYRQNMVIAAPRGRIRLPLEEAKALYFWAYCSNEERKPLWGAGLFRYLLKDGQDHRILTDVASTVRDEDTKSEIDWLITQAFGNKPAPQARGCLPSRSADRSTAIARTRKYGPSGEGKAHRELKEWIAKHPEALKLTDVVNVRVEHPFKSGDLADVVFHHKSGRHTVVEIETTTPLPGAHQAIKYRALLCAQNGLPLDSASVQTFLVAWSIPRDVEDFCRKYGVQFHAHSLKAR